MKGQCLIHSGGGVWETTGYPCYTVETLRLMVAKVVPKHAQRKKTPELRQRCSSWTRSLSQVWMQDGGWVCPWMG